MVTKVERPGAQQWVPDSADIDALRAAAPECRGCELWEPADQVVFGAGNPHAPIVLVGEQPGDVEDRQGVPFVGPAGKLLQGVLDDAGIARSQVYVTNAVKHFRFRPTPKRRMHEKPDLVHVNACRPWLAAELASVAPRLTVVLGATAAAALLVPTLGKGFRVTQHRGELMETDGRNFLVTVHPSSVLRAPDGARAEARAALVEDLRIAAEFVA